MAYFSTSLRAQQPALAPMTPAQAATAPVAPAKAPATNAAPVAPAPDTLGRYGKILVPSDQMEHPLKLKMPFPDVGEIKVPNEDELNMREKLESLAKLSDSDIRRDLAQWPPFVSMNLRDEGIMLQRIQDYRDYHARVALQKANDMGLLSLTPEQKVRFEKEYWSKRPKMERDLARQFEPIFKAREQKLQDELLLEFSPAGVAPVAQAAKTPLPGSPLTNQPPQAPAPATQNKTAVSSPAFPAATNVILQPVPPMPAAQAPR
jgi:hypothetical protein